MTSTGARNNEDSLAPFHKFALLRSFPRHISQVTANLAKALAPQVKREAILRLGDEHHLSERRVCRLVGLYRDSYRHPPQLNAATQALSTRIVEIAHERRRFGYRRIHNLLRPEFSGVNHKRVPALPRG